MKSGPRLRPCCYLRTLSGSSRSLAMVQKPCSFLSWVCWVIGCFHRLCRSLLLRLPKSESLWRQAERKFISFFKINDLRMSGTIKNGLLQGFLFPLLACGDVLNTRASSFLSIQEVNKTKIWHLFIFLRQFLSYSDMPKLFACLSPGQVLWDVGGHSPSDSTSPPAAPRKALCIK